MKSPVCEDRIFFYELLKKRNFNLLRKTKL